MDKTLLSKWLAAGYISEKTLYPTFDGVPQGGVCSPALLVLALSGLEKAVQKAISRKDKVNMASFADNFIITGASKEVLEHKVMPTVIAFLKELGLELSAEKTLITHIEKGFDFLGFNVRKYKGKLLIKPSKKNVKAFLDSIRNFIKSHATDTTESLIRNLNPKIRGWANYYRHAVAKDTFHYVDYHIFKAIWRWVKRRHPGKSEVWRRKKYFRTQGLCQWIFFTAVKNKKGQTLFLDLLTTSQIPISRHVKIKAEATPYDPKFREYFWERERLQKYASAKIRASLRSILTHQSKSSGNRVINGL